MVQSSAQQNVGHRTTSCLRPIADPLSTCFCVNCFHDKYNAGGFDDKRIDRRSARMSDKNNVARTIGASEFDPHAFLDNWRADFIPNIEANDFQSCIKRAFNLKTDDNYVYHAIASVTLQQVQNAINAGGRNGMHAWYRDDQDRQIESPPRPDIEAYTQIFSSKTTTINALNSFTSNAKQASLRFSIGQHLQSHFTLLSPNNNDPLPSTYKLVLPAKQKNPKTLFINPYYDLWAWSCTNLEWAGPTPSTARIRQSHHILPVFYHHFGCIVPTWDAISLLSQLVQQQQQEQKQQSKKDETNNKKPSCILEIGSGNGYWTHLLRRHHHHHLDVIAVDNALSQWRTTWINDTIIADGVAFLQNPATAFPSSLASSSTTSSQSSRSTAAAVAVAAAAVTSKLGGPGCPNALLLLVYPQVSDDLTARLIRAYKGNVVVVAGTQNANGYTAFADQTIDQWMMAASKATTHYDNNNNNNSSSSSSSNDQDGSRGRFVKVAQVPLPSFAGKDEALFVFVRSI